MKRFGVLVAFPSNFVRSFLILNAKKNTSFSHSFYIWIQISVLWEKGGIPVLRIRKLLTPQQTFSCVKTSLGNKLRSSSLWLLIIGCSKIFHGGVRMRMYVAKTVQNKLGNRKKGSLQGTSPALIS